ncbi:hypothetical protein [Bradyrhizobium algeriense]|uniref:hypothetical protein n=1 Tax=Bradyrhizobium algeriense TaxID=634784 RepID=UPI001FCEF647|nr:hypothetical protein [Bradyrhizobium algeriense]
MTKLDERIIAKMDVVLENVCRGLPNSGGDHATRKYVAQKLAQAARKGNTTLDGLEAVGRRALQEIAQGSATPGAERGRGLAGSNSQIRSAYRLH